MEARQPRPGERRLHPVMWSAVLVAFITGLVLVTAGFFSGTFRSFVPVTLRSDRSGLVMESGSKVKMRGVAQRRVMVVGSECVYLCTEGSGPVQQVVSK